MRWFPWLLTRYARSDETNNEKYLMSSIKVLESIKASLIFHVIDRDSHEHNILRKKFIRSALLEYIAQILTCIVVF